MKSKDILTTFSEKREKNSIANPPPRINTHKPLTLYPFLPINYDELPPLVTTHWELTFEQFKKSLKEYRFMEYQKNSAIFIRKHLNPESYRQLFFLGTTIKHISLNFTECEYGYKFGYDYSNIKPNKYGWFHGTWKYEEQIDLLKSNTIRLSRGINNKWAYGLSYCFGSYGGGWRPSYYDPSFNSKEEALKAAYEDLKTRAIKYLNSSSSTNSEKQVIKKILTEIKRYHNQRIQLSLFRELIINNI